MLRVANLTLFDTEDQLLALKVREEQAWDLFVVQGGCTFQGQPREFRHPELPPHPNLRWVDVPAAYLQDGCGRNSKRDAWARESGLRNYLWHNPLPGAALQDYDVVVLSDADEILRRQDLGLVAEAALRDGLTAVRLWQHYCWINTVGGPDHPERYSAGLVAASRAKLQLYGGNLDAARKQRCRPIVATDGHHFGYLLTAQQIAVKLQRFSHTEYAGPRWCCLERIERCRQDGSDLFDRWPHRQHPEPLGPRYPTALLENLEPWRPWIRPL